MTTRDGALVAGDAEQGLGVLLALLTSVLLLLTVAVGVAWSPLANLDHSVATHAFAATYGHNSRIAAWTAVTTYGGPWPMRALLLLGAAGAGVRRRVGAAVWLLALALIEAVVAPTSKVVLDRPRPSWPDPIAVVGSSSFPSGHATAAGATAVALTLVARHVLVTCCAALGAAAVAASRVLLGVHYLSDVVSGLLLGAVLAVATYVLTDWLADREGEPLPSRRQAPLSRGPSGDA